MIRWKLRRARSTAASKGLSAAQLRRVVLRLPENPPITRAFEESDRAERARKPVNYRSQREHIERWLAEYGGPGYYNRKQSGGGAKDFYNRFKCAGGLVWLAEAVGVPETTVRSGIDAIHQAPRNPAAEAGAFRKVVPWSTVEGLIAARPRSLRGSIRRILRTESSR